ncbi:MAG: glycosyltransferase family 39 protein, partial [Bacteroidota bacterium]|nr:glycosyltransferase family 39 protein [Bacteroidota bacterium]MDX5430145.1 glycosyltransferase family 39 protein [Bacteroidota bacterium]MDX5468906.1 glycosyltransferase family 39 protein [Bacteroidota bacterium]
MSRIFKSDSKSKLAFWAAVLAIVVLRLFIADPHHSLSWDVFGYYLYLPAYFIYDDLTLQNMEWVNHIIETYHTTGTLYQAVQVESGNWVMRYPGGLALLNLPFFLMADFLAEPLGYVRDGFSTPYQFAWVFGSMCYAIVGLFFSRKLLRNYFSDRATALLILLLVFATNYLEMATYGNPLAHNFLFALYALGLWMIDRWTNRPKPYQLLAIGVLIGLITMCRPNEGLFLMIPVLWKLWPACWVNPKDFFSKNIPALLLGGIGLFLGGLPQLLYWKLTSGQWLFYSYQDNGVGFDFTSPHTVDFLFSFRKGWFVYTPVMFLAVIGFVQLYRRNRTLFWPFFLFFLLNLYVVSSWSVWWYGGGSYSSRSMVSSYLMLAFPLGYLLEWVKERGALFTRGVWGVLVLLGALNLFQFWQFKAKIIDG